MMEKTPYELLNGRKPNIAYFRVFGCKCYILKKGTRLNKFKKKCDEGFLLGTLEEVYDLGFKCIFGVDDVEIISVDSSNLIFKGFRYENLYLVDFNARGAQLSTCLLTKSTMGWLWHRRLGHVGMK
jgi:hypothetical protein